MAATDKHYRNQKTLNIVFAFSCVAMLLSVLWMLVDDYKREYKKVQRDFRDVEESLSLNTMLDNLPHSSILTAARESVAEKRTAIEEKKKGLDSEMRRLAVLRTKAGSKAQDTKAQYDAVSSYRNLDADKLGEARTEAERSAALKQIDDRDRELEKLKTAMDEAQKELDEVNAEYYDKISRKLKDDEEALSKAEDYLKEIVGTFDRFAKLTAEKRWKAGDTFRNLPILDGFAPPTKINQIVLNDLTIDYGGFKDVTRYDRCTSCHLAIENGTYSRAALQEVADVREPDKAISELIQAVKAAELKSARAEAQLDSLKESLNDRLADTRKALKARDGFGEAVRDLAGEVRKAEPLVEKSSYDTVSAALRRLEASASRQTKLWAVQDMLQDRKKSDEKLTFDPDDVPSKLKEVKLSAGQITQYAAHPRLDLFVGSNSTHPMEKFGCTICHSGQGSATSFGDAAHVPNNVEQMKRWQGSGEGGHHWHMVHTGDWAFPMLPSRFTESSCLKCHHQVTDLVRHGAKEEAPKLLEGFHLVKENGCFGCHEISGSKSGRPIGPDLRLEPAPPLEWLPVKDQLTAKADTLNPPGTLRKVGPSLRRLVEKATNPDDKNLNPWLLSWIKDPRGFRPDTKMPHFYGQSTNSKDYLTKEYQDRKEKTGSATDQSLYPDAELYSIAYYLQTESAKSLGGEDTTRRAVRMDLEAKLADLEASTAVLQLYRELERTRELKLALEKKNTLAKAKPQTADVQNQLKELDRRIPELTALLSIEQKTLVELEKSPEKLNARSADITSKLDQYKADKKALTESAVFSRITSDLSRKQARVKKELDALRRRYRDLALLSRPMNRAAINDKADVMQERLDESIQPGLLEEEVKQLFARIRELLKDLQEKETLPIAAIAAKKELIDSRGKAISWADVPGETEGGKNLFTEKGCLACHSHTGVVIEVKDPGGEIIASDSSEANFGPELSRIGLKLGSDKANARRWLVQWILNPNVYHPRTRMPITHLEPKEAAAIADWLLSNNDGWKPQTVSSPSSATLTELALMSLVKVPAVGRQNARAALEKGLPKDYALTLAPDADEQLLVENNKDGAIDDQRLMRYIGKKAIGRMGCYACHDIPGFEAAKPIGTALNDWGKKDGERLAFEDAEAFIRGHFAIADTRDDPANPKTPSGAWLSAGSGKDPAYEKFFVDGVRSHQRESFLSLKLAEPRSYDYNRVREWDDRLRMPQFKFARTHRRGKEGSAEPVDAYKERRDREAKRAYDAETQYEEAKAREAVMTFVLGLVADPIPLKFLNNPTPDRAAEAKGRMVLEKYNCAGCHEVRPGVYEFNIPESRKADFLTRLESGFDPKDHVFPESTAWTGRPSPIPGRMVAFGVSTDDRPTYKSEDKAYRIRLTEALRYQDARGATRSKPAGDTIDIPADGVLDISDTYGGDFARLIGPYLKKKDSTTFSGMDTQRAALPPPLLREGEKVQTQWLFKFLLDPQKVRLTVLRMPKFNMSEEEARALVEYFAAADKLNNPNIGLNEAFAEVPQKDWSFWVRKNEEYKASKDAKFGKHLEEQRAGLPLVWERSLKERIAVKERDVEGVKFGHDAARKETEAAEKAAKDDPKDMKKAEELTKRKAEETLAKGRLDEAEKELKAIKDDLSRADKSDAFKNFADSWQKEQVYASDAYRLVTDARSICMTCHSAGNLRISAEKGPNLELANERLRPNWTYQWIANPNRLTTYPSLMPQNFPKGTPPDPHFLIGPPRQYAEAARDVLMNLPTIGNLDVNRYRLAPKGGK